MENSDNSYSVHPKEKDDITLTQIQLCTCMGDKNCEMQNARAECYKYHNFIIVYVYDTKGHDGISFDSRATGCIYEWHGNSYNWMQ